MNFRTEYRPELSSRPLDPEKGVVLIGSCFSDSIGARMQECMWPALPNPCGVLYNPVSVAAVLELACCADPESCRQIIRESLTCRDGIRHSWLMDSGVSGSTSSQTEKRIDDSLRNLREGLEKAQALIVTFGTSWCYELSGRKGTIVANCHKYPSDHFRRRRLGIDEIVNRWKILIETLRARHPDLKIIFTVSPIRHLKDGLEGNTRSKAVLQLACELICEDTENAEYFPAYEILLDDLRDYRFYGQDMTHPSPQAVEYIWEKFCSRYLTTASAGVLAEGEKIVKSFRHRPILNADDISASEQFAIFRKKAIERYLEFIGRHPGCKLPDSLLPSEVNSR